MVTSPPPASTPQRVYEIDVLKAVSILAVVLIHSIRSPWDPTVSPWELWLGHVTSFAVPSFMAASGFLWAGDTTPSVARTIRRRLRRLLIPYLLVSIAVQLTRAATGAPATMPNVLKDLLFGSTYHIYYYVFVAVIFVFATPLFRKIPLALWPGFAAFLVGASLISRGFGWGPDAASFISISTYLRNPFMFAGYFAIGWLGRLHYPLLRARIAADPYRPLLLAVIAVAICLLLFALPIATHAMFAAHWEYHYAVIALLFVAACHTQRSGKLVRFLSDSSYAIFLIHPAWITAADQLLGITKIEAAIPATLTRLTIGLFGAIGVMFSVQRLAPRLSRDLIGA